MEDLFYEKLHQRYPIKEIYESIERKEVSLFHAEKFTKNLSLVLDRNQYYGKRVIKLLIDNSHKFDIDGSNINLIRVVGHGSLEFFENLYEQYITLLHVNMPSSTYKDIVRYKFSNNEKIIHIDINEVPSLISSAGCTGFRTWEAAIYLCEFIMVWKPDISINSVLELGSGTGIVSILWYKLNKNCQLWVTDGDSSLLDAQLRHNFQLNFDKNSLDKVHFKRLCWNVDDIPKTDIILAADVTYDQSVILDLILCIKQALIQGAKFSLISATVRNSKTIEIFEHTCIDHDLSIDVLVDTDSNHMSIKLPHNLIAPIRIYKIQL